MKQNKAAYSFKNHYQPPFYLKHSCIALLAIAASPLLWSGVAQAGSSLPTLSIEGGAGGSAVTSTGSGTPSSIIDVDGDGGIASIDDGIAGAGATGGNGALISNNTTDSQNTASDVDVTTPGSYTSPGSAGNNAFGQGTAYGGLNGTSSTPSTAQGGKGGNADLTLSGTQAFKYILLTGGNGGAGSGVGAVGGAGGSINFSILGDLTLSNALNISTGSAGSTSSSPREVADQEGFGGRGGDVTFTVQGNMFSESISLEGGTGGDVTDSNQAASAAGDLFLTIHGDLYTNDFEAIGGDGGDASNLAGGTGGHGGNLDIHMRQSAYIEDLDLRNGTSDSTGTVSAQGGNGGNVTLTVNETLMVKNLGVDVWYDQVAADNDGIDGTVTLNANTLIVEDGYFRQGFNSNNEYGDNLVVNVGTLLVLPNTTSTLNFEDNNPAKTVFSTIHLSDNSALEIEENNGGFSFNTLKVSGLNAVYDTSSTSNVLNAQNKSLVFDLPSTITAGDTMLFAPSGVDVQGATVTLLTSTGVPLLRTGDAVTLIDNTTGTVNNTGTEDIFYGATEYNFKIESGTSLLARLVGKKILTDPETGEANGYAKVYAEGLLAPMLSLSNSTDVIVGMGMMNAELAQIKGNHLFINTSASHIKGNTGSHISSDNYHLLTGVSLGMETAQGKFTVAPFAEYGKGDYNSYNSFGFLSVSGSGDVRYWGAGVMGKYHFNNGIYLDGSLRGGRIKSDFSSNSMGWGSNYDTNSTYYGAHMGVGYLMELASSHHVDAYAKLLWTHQKGDDVYTKALEWIDYDNVNSLRTRLGVRYQYDIQENTQLLLGAAWDYETDGEMDAHISGIKIQSPSLRGHTGVLEAGFNWQPTPNWDLQFNVFGLAGKREGGGGSVYINYKF